MDVHIHEHLRSWDKCASVCASVCECVCVNTSQQAACASVTVAQLSAFYLDELKLGTVDGTLAFFKAERARRQKEEDHLTVLSPFYSGIQGFHITLMGPRRPHMSAVPLDRSCFRSWISA